MKVKGNTPWEINNQQMNAYTGTDVPGYINYNHANTKVRISHENSKQIQVNRSLAN